MLRDRMMSVIMLRGRMLSGIMLSVILPSVVELSVAAPLFEMELVSPVLRSQMKQRIHFLMK
jgi:hypothetical protein